MKKLNKCEVENCIPTPASCVEWNGGDIEFLGICNGDSLTNLMWEVITKLEDVAGEDLSQFDIDSLIDICNLRAPNEITLLSILNLIRDNQICLKDFIDNLSEQLATLLNTQSVNVNLKCYATFDNLGNSLSITRDQLDQLIIDNLCDHETRLDGHDGAIVNLQSQINNLNNTSTVEELSFGTCVNPSSLPTSTQVINLANAFCDLQDATGNPADISAALANTPSTDNARYSLIAGWILVPANWAENYSNLLLKLANLETRLIAMEDGCCALSCKDLELGFSAVYNEDGDGIIISFTFGAGTDIPVGFTDTGSTGTITDSDGNTVDFNIVISNNSTTEIPISGLNTSNPLTIDITAVMSTEAGLTCQKCLSRVVKFTGCGFCEITATGSEGSQAVIVYESDALATHS